MLLFSDCHGFKTWESQVEFVITSVELYLSNNSFMFKFMRFKEVIKFSDAYMSRPGH